MKKRKIRPYRVLWEINPELDVKAMTRYIVGKKNVNELRIYSNKRISKLNSI